MLNPNYEERHGCLGLTSTEISICDYRIKISHTENELFFNKSDTPTEYARYLCQT